MRRVLLVSTTLAALAVVATTALSQRPSGAPGRGERGGFARFNPLIRLFDADGDGVLGKEEIEGAAAKLKEFDKSQDGKLTAEELMEALPFGPGRGRFGPGGPPGGAGRPSFGRGGRPGGRPSGGGVSESEFDAPPLPKDDQEKKILAALEAMREGPRFRNVSASDGRLLRLLAETTGAKNVVEIGTSTGESAVWLALGLRTTGGHLFTHEIDEGRAKTAEENFKKAGVDNLITIVLGDAHETVKPYKEPIDILFLDADKEGYIDYLDKLVPLIRPGGLIVAHNMNPRQADKRYLEAITKNPDFETAFLLMEGTGVGVTMKKR
ncbi:MAG: class I SAM-dependent methyltransferase [Planctomycetota bacterium]|jgi:predicted O-methyltransferase YrrM